MANPSVGSPGVSARRVDSAGRAGRELSMRRWGPRLVSLVVLSPLAGCEVGEVCNTTSHRCEEQPCSAARTECPPNFVCTCFFPPP